MAKKPSPRKKLLTTSGPSAIIGNNQKPANTATETSSRAQDAPREPRVVESGSGRLCELTPEWPTQTGLSPGVGSDAAPALAGGRVVGPGRAGGIFPVNGSGTAEVFGFRLLVIPGGGGFFTAPRGAADAF